MDAKIVVQGNVLKRINKYYDGQNVGYGVINIHTTLPRSYYSGSVTALSIYCLTGVNSHWSPLTLMIAKNWEGGTQQWSTFERDM